MAATGLSPEDAIVIEAEDEMRGIAAEYAWLAQHLGQRGKAWELEIQALMQHDGRYMDCLKVKLRDGTVRDYYFDISAFFGKM